MTDVENNEEKQEVALLVFSNDKTEEHLNVLRGLLKMLYHAAFTNQIAIMEAKNKVTGESEVVLVGVRQNGDALDCYPIFKPLAGEEASQYLAPDGKGGYLGDE